jgi:hypothetical protein
MNMHGSQLSRRGAVMIVVMGLITILLSLALGVTVKVYNGIKNGSNVTQNAQAWIMMQSARMFLANQVKNGTVPWATSGTALTIGNLLSTDIPSKAMDDRLGWAHIQQMKTGVDAYWHVLASGGGSGQNGLKAISLTDGDAVRNAMDVRYQYEIIYDEPILPATYGSFSINLLKAATEAYTVAYFW